MNWRVVALSRWRLARATLLGSRRARRPAVRTALATLLGTALAGSITLSLILFFQQLADGGATAREGSVALALILTAALGGLFAFDLHEAVTTLVVDPDLELLRRAPVKPAALIALKLADALPRTSALIAILALPALVAFSVVYPVPWWCWTLAPVGLLALWAIPLGVGIAVAVALVRAVPAPIAREILGLVSTFAIVLLWLANSFVLPRLGAAGEAPVEIVRSILAAAPTAYRLSPGTWIANVLGEAHAGAVEAALSALGLALAAAVLALALAVWTATRCFDEIHQRVFAAARRGHPAAARARRAPILAAAASEPASVSARPATGARPGRIVGALLRRDLRLFIRDWTVLGDVLTAILLWTLLPLVGAPLYPTEPAWLARAMLVGLTVALGYEVGARAIPFERRGLAWMRLAPVTLRRWLLARWLGTGAVAVPVVALASIVIAVAMRIPAVEMTRILALIVPALALSLSVGIWTGAAFGNPEWAHPRAMLTIGGRLVATGLLLVQALLWLTLAWYGAGPWVWAVPVVAVILCPAALAAAAGRLARREAS